MLLIMQENYIFQIDKNEVNQLLKIAELYIFNYKYILGGCKHYYSVECSQKHFNYCGLP